MCRDFDVHCQTVNDMANDVTSTLDVINCVNVFPTRFSALLVLVVWPAGRLAWTFFTSVKGMASSGLVTNSDSPDADCSLDEEVGRIFSPPLLKRPKRHSVAATCQQLVRSLRSRWGLSESICRVLEANKVDETTFLALTRDDLPDLLSEFKQRKTLWDCLQRVHNSGLRYPFKEEGEDQSALDLTASPTSTLSVDSGSESDSASPPQTQSSTSKVPKLKRTHQMELTEQNRAKGASKSPTTQDLSKSSTQLDDKFKFPVSKHILDCVREGKSLEEKDRKQLIRDCVTCLKAECGEHINKLQFKLASQIICSKVPVLKDVRPPSWPENEEFCHYASVEYLLRKRYTNIKGRNKKEKVVDSPNLDTTQDADLLHKELTKELKKGKKKKETNWAVVNKLLKLSFKTRRDNIQEMSGTNVVNQILEKYPFLDDERILWSELELHLSEELDEDVSCEEFFNRWQKIAKCFLGDAIDQGDICLAALKEMPKVFSPSAPQLLSFIPDGSNPEDFLKTLTSNDPQLLCYNGDKDPTNTVQDPKSQQLFIAVDKEIIVECESYSACKALITLVAVHYAFNLKYNSGHAGLFKFLQEHVFGVLPKRKSYAYRKLENTLLSRLVQVTGD